MMRLRTIAIRFWRKYQRALWIAAAVFPFIYVFTPAIYFGKKLRAQVVDSATLQPVSGVRAETVWSVWRPTLNMGSHRWLLHKVVATTDADGFFEIPSWGPKFVPRWYSLATDGPGLVLQFPQYEDRLIGDYVAWLDSKVRVLVFKRLDADWNRVRIKLHRVDALEPLREQGGDPY
jgi:hypothetical protein